MACYSCQRGWHDSMGGEVAWVASVGWVVCLRGWCASVDKVGNVLAWLAHQRE